VKVVLFCGGLGLRIRDYSDSVPKPLVPIGSRPMLWHVMKYYSHFGHKDFILCLGYRGRRHQAIFFGFTTNACQTILPCPRGGRNLHLFNSDIHDWKITFVDTGVDCNIGQRLRGCGKNMCR